MARRIISEMLSPRSKTHRTDDWQLSAANRNSRNSGHHLGPPPNDRNFQCCTCSGELTEEQVQLSGYSSCSVIVQRAVASLVNYAVALYRQLYCTTVENSCVHVRLPRKWQVFAEYQAAPFGIMTGTFGR